MAVNVHSEHDSVLDCEDVPALLATPLERCPEEPYASQECILTEELAPILNRWLERAIADAAEANGGGWHPRVGVRGLLCESAGVPERRLFGILQEEQASVGLDTADRLLQAADIPMWEVTVYLSREVREAVVMQTEMMRTIAKTTGHFIPQGPSARLAIPHLRRKMLAGA